MDESRRTEASFLEWVSACPIYVGYARYGQLGGHGFVCATNYDDPHGRVDELVKSIDAGDIEAIDAAEEIARDGSIFWSNDPDPAKAMQKMLDKMRTYYFSMVY